MNTLNVKKEFKKKGRSIYLMGQYNKTLNEDSVKWKSENNFYIEQRYDILDQQRNRINNSEMYHIRLNYNEPLSKQVTLTLGGYQSGGTTDSRTNTFERDPEHNTYTKKLDSLSNDYRYNNGTTGGLLRIAYKYKKWELSAGTSAERNTYTLRNLVLDTLTKYSALKWIPNAVIVYNFSRSHRLRVSYNGNTNPPRMDQLEPLQDNTDPLNIITGNPNLKQEYRQSIDLNYNKSQVLSGNYTYASIWGSNTINAIQSNRFVDASGRTVTTYENVNGNYFFRGNVGQYFSLSEGIDINAGLSTNLSKQSSFINRQRTQVRNQSLGPSVGISYEIDDKLDISVNYNPEWNFSSGGLIGENIQYYSHNIYGGADYEFSKRLKFETDIEIEQQNPQTSFDQKFERYLWNASLSYFLLKNNQLEVKLAVNDILNNNNGFSRNINSQSITEDRYNTIRRYAMLSLIYNFKNMNKKSNDVDVEG